MDDVTSSRYQPGRNYLTSGHELLSFLHVKLMERLSQYLLCVSVRGRDQLSGSWWSHALWVLWVPSCPVIINCAFKQKSVEPRNTFKQNMHNDVFLSQSHDSMTVSLTSHASISLLQIFMSPLSVSRPSFHPVSLSSSPLSLSLIFIPSRSLFLSGSPFISLSLPPLPSSLSLFFCGPWTED